MPKHIKTMNKRNKSTCGCEICTGSMLLQSDLNKWRLTQLEKLDKLYINAASTRILQKYKIDYIVYKNQKISKIFTNTSKSLWWFFIISLSLSNCRVKIPWCCCILTVVLIFMGWMHWIYNHENNLIIYLLDLISLLKFYDNVLVSHNCCSNIHDRHGWYPAYIQCIIF